MEATKKKYNKKIVEGKITVKHYLHKNKHENNNGSIFSIYVLLTVKRQVVKFKSKIEPYNLIEEQEWKVGNYGNFKGCINRDIDLIQFIVSNLKPFENDNFNTKDVVKIYNLEEINLQNSFDNFLVWEISDFFKERKIPTLIKPISYLGFYINENTKNKRASYFKSKIWFLEAIIFDLWHFNSGYDGYSMLKPTIYDFISGNFFKAINEKKILSVEDSKNLFEEMTELYNIYQKEYWIH